MTYSLSDWIWLSNYRIDENVTLTSPGVYVLSISSLGPILYVGRADSGLDDRLKGHIREKHRLKDQIGEKYKLFKFDSPIFYYV